MGAAESWVAEVTARRPWPGTLALLIGGAGLYGAVLGSWHGARLALYAGVKLPLALIGTALLTASIHAVLAAGLGLRLSWLGSLLLCLRALAHASVVLLAVAPIAAWFTWTGPAPEAAARTAHNLLFLLHTSLTAGAGVAGALTLAGELRRRAPSARSARLALTAWIATFALVGGEVTWALRPFVGSVYEPVAFLRPDALNGNVYEFVAMDILPHLLRKIGGEP
jgi:hypothetical protein